MRRLFTYLAQTKNTFNRAVCIPIFVLTESDFRTEKNVCSDEVNEGVIAS